MAIHVVKDTTDPGQIQKAVDQEEDGSMTLNISSLRSAVVMVYSTYIRCHASSVWQIVQTVQRLMRR